MSAIGPGDFVECVRVSADPSRPKCGFSVGGVYRVIEVMPNGGLEFAAMPRAPRGFGWDATCFRPIYRPNDKLIRDLLQPVKEDA